MTDTTYNGHANRATWAVSLWLDNDESLYREIRRQSRRLIVQHGKRAAVGHLAADLRGIVTDGNPLADDSSMYADMLSHAISTAAYGDIAQNIIDEEADETEE